MSLFRLGEAQFRQGLNEQQLMAMRHQAARKLFQALGQPAGRGRVVAVAAAHSNLDCAAEANQAANDALVLCRCGDLYGVGNALNMLMFNEAGFRH